MLEAPDLEILSLASADILNKSVLFRMCLNILEPTGPVKIVNTDNVKLGYLWIFIVKCTMARGGHRVKVRRDPVKIHSPR